MSLIKSVPFSQDFAGVFLSANGQNLIGSNYPQGIPGRLEILGNALQTTVYPNDALTHLGRRAEVEIGSYAANSGEIWSKFDFMLPSGLSYTQDWSFGSWYATPDVGDTTKYVPLGFRIDVNGQLHIQSGADMPTESTNKVTLVRHPLQTDTWHTIVCHALLSTTAGAREIFLDRVPIFRDYGLPTTYIDAAGPYLKLGPYAHVAGNTYGYLRMYFRNVEMWIGSNGYQSVMGGAPIAPTRVLQL